MVRKLMSERPIPIFTGRLINGVYHLNFKDRYQSYLSKLPDGDYEHAGPYTPSVRITKKQLGYFFAVILYHYRKIYRFAGWDDAAIKEWLYGEHSPRHEEPGKPAEIITMSDKRMTTKLAEEFFERCRVGALMNDGVQIPLPNETYFEEKH